MRPDLSGMKVIVMGMVALGVIRAIYLVCLRLAEMWVG